MILWTHLYEILALEFTWFLNQLVYVCNLNRSLIITFLPAKIVTTDLEGGRLLLYELEFFLWVDKGDVYDRFASLNWFKTFLVLSGFFW